VSYRLSLVAAFLRRDWAIARSYRLNFALNLFDSVVSLVLFFYLGQIVDQSELAAESQLSKGYFAFAVLGLALIRVIQTGVTSFALRIRQDQETGTLEALLVTPAPPSFVVLGSATYALLTATLSSLLMVVLAVLFFGLRLTLDYSHLLALLVAVPASLVLFVALGIAVAAFTVVFKQTASLMSFVTIGIAVFAGVYFPVSVLPSALEFFANVLPFTWSLDVFRAALLGGDVAITKLLLLTGFAFIAVPLSLALFRSAVNHARRAGSLAQY
jgi:ABC-2 type transport system permease protein